MNVFYPEGKLILSEENKKYLSSAASLSAAMNEQKILEARVTVCEACHSLTVDLGCMRGIIPREEGAIGIKEGTTRDIALISRVGKPVCFTVEEIKTDSCGKKYAVLSRRKAQEKCKSEYIKELCPGDIIDAKVTHLETFGAFCDIGCGIAALLPIDAISVSRISHPKDRFSVGDDIRVAIRSNEDGKITLTLKELLGTWEENAARFSPGQTVTGIVRSIEDYGVFVELTPNLAGLAEPHPDIYIGKRACVYIKSINPEKMKIKLVLIDSFGSDEKPKIDYFYTGDRIEKFDYSPLGACKRIYTEFEP